MADNLLLNAFAAADAPANGRATLATKEISAGIHAPRIVLVDSTGNPLVSPTTGMVIGGAAADNAAPVGNPVPVAGRYSLVSPTYDDGDIGYLRMTVNGLLRADVVGGVAHAGTDSGNPVKIGGVYNSAGVAITNGQRGDAQMDAAASLIARLRGSTVSGGDAASNSSLTSLLHATDAATATTQRPLVTAGFAFNGTSWDRIRNAGSALGLLMENGPYSCARTIADVQYKAAAGFVRSITVTPLTGTPTAGLITLYDSLTETGTVKWQKWFAATDPGGTYILDAPFATGIYVGFDATAANWSVSVTYR